MKVAITGASGFLGRYVLGALSKSNVEVVVLVRNVEKLDVDVSDIHVVEGDIAETGIDWYRKLESPDVLIHLAWGGLPNYKSRRHFEFELPIHYKFLESLVQGGLQSLLVVGTCFEYGDQTGCLSENQKTEPNNPYGFAKDTLRKQLEFLKLEYQFAFSWTRLFYLYGDGQAKSALFSQLRAAIVNEDRIFNMSGGKQIRDFMEVSTVAHKLVQLAVLQQDLGIVNVCSGVPVSVQCLVEGWLEDNQWAIELNLGHFPYPDYEPMSFWGDSSKLDRILSPF